MASALQSQDAANWEGESRSEAGDFCLRDMREILADLFVHRPGVYWADFLVTTSIGYAFAMLYLHVPMGLAPQVVCFLIAGFALFRTASFMHEIAHMRRGLMTGFRAAWNLLFGIPTLMPSLLYSNHLDHHRRHHYGTASDGEYQPFARRPVSALFRYFGQVLVLPVLAVFRFGVLTPVSLICPPLRPWVLERFSSYGSNFNYRRTLSKSEPYKLWIVVELACCACVLSVLVRMTLGFAPWSRLLLLYALAVFTVGLNWLRNLAGHHFRNDGEPMTAFSQLLDSVTITGHPLWTELLFPLGLRYHALHHLYPSIPYHNLGTAHRRLMAQLPADAPYCRTVYPNLRSVLRKLWSEARASSVASELDRVCESEQVLAKG
jgi:fatty acid desaturase